MRRLVPLLVAVGLLAGGPSPAAAWSWRTGTVSVEATIAMRSLINAEHYRACGRNLTHDRQLRDVARWKAADMALHGTFSHRDEGGHRAFDFYGRAGIAKTYGAGEIIARNTWPLEQTVRVAFDGWMSSSTHRALIRNCDYDRFGVGTFRAGASKYYVVEFSNVVAP